MGKLFFISAAFISLVLPVRKVQRKHKFTCLALVELVTRSLGGSVPLA